VCVASIALSATAQEDHRVQVGVAVSGVFGQGAPMAGAQLAAQVPLANPDIQLRFGVQYAQSGTTSWPGQIVIDCFGGSCPSLTASDQLMAVTAGARFDLPATDSRLYLIATTAAYQWRVNSNQAYDLHQSATGFALGGGIGTSFSIGSARLFAEGQVLLGNVSRGAYETTALFPFTLGVRF
jgi:hypothetical protein